MGNTDIEILSILKHNLELDLKATEAFHKIREVECQDKVGVHTAQN